MKKIISVLLVISLVTLSGCGLLFKSNKESSTGNGKQVNLNGVTVTLDETETYMKQVSFLMSSDLKANRGAKYYTYTLPADNDRGLPEVYNRFYLSFSSASYQTLEQMVNNIQTETDTYSSVSISQKEINGYTWTYASFKKHLPVVEVDETVDLYMHQYMLEKDFDGTTELVTFNFVRADDIEEFENEVMNSVTFLK